MGLLCTSLRTLKIVSVMLVYTAAPFTYTAPPSCKHDERARQAHDTNMQSQTFNENSKSTKLHRLDTCRGCRPSTGHIHTCLIACMLLLSSARARPLSVCSATLIHTHTHTPQCEHACRTSPRLFSNTHSWIRRRSGGLYQGSRVVTDTAPPPNLCPQLGETQGFVFSAALFPAYA